MNSYNGFSSNERANVGRKQLEAIKSGKFMRATKCELCLQTTGQMQFHNEDYSKPFDDAHPICRSCHSELHIRFSKPDRWIKRKQTIRELRGTPGGDIKEVYWWEKLLLEPIDINPAH